MAAPFGGQPPHHERGFGTDPPVIYSRQHTPVERRAQGGPVLAVVSVVIGVCALLLAFVPFYIGAIAAVAGIAGLSVGIVALMRQGTDGPGLATTGIATSALAIVAGIVMTLVYASGPRAAAPTAGSQTVAERSDTKAVLANELEVTIGDYVSATGPYRDNGELSLTLRNRLDQARMFFVRIGAFEGDTQLASDLITATLNAGQTKVTKGFEVGVGFEFERLKNAEFRVIEATSHEPK
ncbi:hypothetical protein [Mycolicibacterium mageritense]|uniref:hypothetical protein n=1 Tax=Mycolicibacterium mageritense TaxID=53462 RepID=UPI001E3FE3A0|nr:hypothetical protein [Mycolicibacterium mageritense]GJJ17689.1 hypothetical protein MTY414_13620 [Mycolicibacterium mageritense]